LRGRQACDPSSPRQSPRVALLDLTLPQLEDFVLSLGEPSYRADQLYKWLYSSLATEFEEMSNLPRALRQRLAEVADLHTLRPVMSTRSSDGLTRKVLFALPDGETIEAVLMLYDDRRTVCLSSQVGCPVGCAFCATGKSGFVRNLSSGEILEQVLHFQRELRDHGQRVTNVVFMGMGEPLLNYEATWEAVQRLTDPRGINLGARRITISSIGVVPAIQRLIGERSQVGLAVSLHAPTDDLRRTLIPLAAKYPLRELMDVCGDYVERTGRRVTFEYALIAGVNDSLQQARQLAHLLKGLLCHVNLIPLNPIEDSSWQASSPEQVRAFQGELRRLRVNATTRLRRGADIEAGCGQLRSRLPSGVAAEDCLCRP
jgi:23S rRNA (adenine2503-C2)-methyltransferase